VEVPITEVEGKEVRGFRRLGKRIVWELEADLFIVLHLMIAGRLRWKAAGAKVGGKLTLAAFDFPEGTLVLTEASTRKRASMHVVREVAALDAFDRGGEEPLTMTAARFREVLRTENHTLKRSLTDPRLFSGIGNAYSDEILYHARLSPFKQTSYMDDEEMARLYTAIRATLREWVKRLRKQTGDGFPDKVTAFHDEMAVHGRYGQPCRQCGAPVQRIRYADNECNYCAACQTDGRLLADRALSRLLKQDWPRTLAELENSTPTDRSPGGRRPA
jgi:formamidopyrimidine-DNA glycosylase